MKYRLAIAWILRLILVVLLTFSGVGKLLNGRTATQFILTLTNSNPVVEEHANGLIIGLSIFEIALAGALLHRRSVRIGLVIFSGILLLFSAVLAVALARDGPMNSCGCFGGFGGEMSIETALLRNLILLAAASGCYLLLDSTPHADEKSQHTEGTKVW